MCGVLYNRKVIEILRQHVLIYGSDRLVLRASSGNVEYLDRIHPMNGSEFGDINDTVVQELVSN